MGISKDWSFKKQTQNRVVFARNILFKFLGEEMVFALIANRLTAPAPLAKSKI